QAEDGIRAFHVTGVQTCALPISCKRLCDSSQLGGGFWVSLGGHSRSWAARCGTITRRDAGVEPTGTYPRRVPHLAVRFLPSLEPPPPQPNKPKNPPSSHFIQPTLINQKQSDSMNPNHQSSSRNPLSPKQKLAQK